MIPRRNIVLIAPGLSFGSRYVVSPLEGEVYDYLPEAMIGRVRNIDSFAGILALDKWTCNADGRLGGFLEAPLRAEVQCVVFTRPRILIHKIGRSSVLSRDVPKLLVEATARHWQK